MAEPMVTPTSVPQLPNLPQPEYPRKQRQRSSIACQSCNTRRVKCNASQGLPCSNCQRGARECKLIESKRGKRKSRPNVTGAPPSDLGGEPLTRSTLIEGSLSGRRDGQPERRESDENGDNGFLDHDVPVDSAGYATANTRTNDRLGTITARPEDSDNESHRDGSGPETLYAQMLEADKSRSKRRKLMKPGGQVVYLGETFNLTYLLHQNLPEENGDDQRPRLHYPLPIDVAKSSAFPEKGPNDGQSLLQLQGAFELPDSDICLELFSAYFEHVQPHYPIIDRALFLFQYAVPQNPPSWLLLQAVLFMAAGHCEESLLQKAGFQGRYDARLTLFKRTKALYDADHDTNKVTIVQAVFLMSFWWATPVDSKDTWHWLGIAISLALTIGMHRSTKNSGMSLKDQRLWKKIWWSLFTEDKHAAAALGRPVHIRLSDCDVEPLEVSDFADEPDGMGRRSPKVYSSYVIFLSSLSKIVERIIQKSTSSSGSLSGPQTLELCEGMLQVWEAGLPEELQLTSANNDTVWPSMLHIAACWFRILAHRTRPPHDPSTPSRDDAQQKAMNSAIQMVRIVEDLLASGQIQHCPIHIIPALFAAMSMLAIKIKSGDKVSQQLAYVKVKLCMIALRELQSSWPVSGWIFLLFAKIVRGIRDVDEGKGEQGSNRAVAERPNTADSAHARHNAQDSDRHARTLESQHQESPWQHAPVPEGGQNTYSYNAPLSATIPNNNGIILPMPLDLSTDWSGVRDEDLWLVPGFDFMPGTNDFGGFPGM